MRNKGLIHIYTGEGKGKTTSAFGLALRASGHGEKVGIFQFLKNSKVCSGEAKSVKQIPKIETVRFRETHPCFRPVLKKEYKKKDEKNLKKQIKKDFDIVKDDILAGKYDVFILDEIINAVSEGYLKEDIVIDFIKNKPDITELVLTVRNTSERLKESADYVTEMQQIKHPYQKGIEVRKGIEY